MTSITRLSKCSFVLLWLWLFSNSAFAQDQQGSFEIYGVVLVDAGYNFNSSDPAWFDVMRPTRLPKFKDEFGPAGNTFFGVRQTKLGFKSSQPTKWGELKTHFDFDLFGFGKDAGQTTLHVVNAYGQLGKFLAGQAPSTFMDPDVFPVTLDYWGPCSRIFYLNIQLRYSLLNNEKQRLAVALERPGGSADGTDYSNSVNLENVQPHFPFPNLAAHYRHDFKWGYARLSGILKYLEWEEIPDTTAEDLNGKDLGWGINISAVINASKGVRFKVQGEYGEGYENYIADSSPDVALQSNPGNLLKPVQGKALPAWGVFGFMEFDWCDNLSSSMGYSVLQIENTDLQSPNAFRRGHYGLFNIRWLPADNVLLGIEYQYGRRDNFKDGFNSTGNKIQCSFEYHFSKALKNE
ncbi:MAG TPA: DcaP family trimeric outer membrane transporter [Saprospiraceae bacterium]|nr:DcaP family trimeric outer membrane transporter [Saprospiraceae bacterium]